MAYDCCGTIKLEGEELLRRLAKALGMTVEQLKERLK
jgi:pyrroloquinoline quinone (PQQ) biosynthesis protein C